MQNTPLNIFDGTQDSGVRSLNLVSLVIQEHHLSFQGALNMVGTMIKERFDEFSALEAAIIENAVVARGSMTTQPSTTLRSMVPVPFQRLFATPPNQTLEMEETNINDLLQLIQTLKDMVIGTIHWGYEAELFFGSKGHEMRDYGWVFVDVLTLEQSSHGKNSSCIDHGI